MTVPGGYKYGGCRLWGHAWMEVPSDWTPAYGIPMTVRCERCDMERRDAVGRYTGMIESRRYVYPEGYEITTEEGYDRPARVDFRLEWLESHLIESPPEPAPTTKRRKR